MGAMRGKEGRMGGRDRRREKERGRKERREGQSGGDRQTDDLLQKQIWPL